VRLDNAGANATQTSRISATDSAMRLVSELTVRLLLPLSTIM
jgi:hypothetical protein